jgi:hypothetical protein
MANRYYTEFQSRKISGKQLPDLKAGSTMAMPEKAAFASAKLPGKAQPKNRSGGTPKCKIYPKSEGL